MAVNPMMEQARVNGMNSAIKGLNQAAQDVAELNVDRVGDEATHAPATGAAEQADALLDLQLYERQVQASAKVATTADAVLGFLLDVHA